MFKGKMIPRVGWYPQLVPDFYVLWPSTEGIMHRP